MNRFADKLAILPAADHLAHIELTGPGGAVEIIENKPGSQGSLRVYLHLAQKHGALGPEAAREGLDIYAEHTADARTHPGKHPNIDRLLRIEAEGLRYAIRLQPA